MPASVANRRDAEEVSLTQTLGQDCPPVGAPQQVADLRLHLRVGGVRPKNSIRAVRPGPLLENTAEG
jgi:hypothetical protein